MKIKLLFLFVLLYTVTYSQDKDEIRELFWSKSDIYKNATETPEKWKNESAVVIYKYEYNNYKSSGGNIVYSSAIRKRIKLQDQVAVKEFSEFSFNDKFYSKLGYSYKKGSTFFAVKIIKANGKEIEIDVEKEAKKLDEEKKIAIANLEIGDILDYYYYSFEPFSATYMTFSPVENTLGDVYPVMNKKISLIAENDFYLNLNSYNGAPKFKEIIGKKKYIKEYELEVKDIEKNDFPRWFYPLVEMPCYKFQVYFGRSGAYANYKFANVFLPQEDTYLKKTVTKDDIFEYYNEKNALSANLKPVKAFLKDKEFNSDEDKVKAVYNFARHSFYTQYIEAAIIKEADLFYPYSLFEDVIYLSDQQSFIQYFMTFLKEYKIDYDLVIGTGRDNGSLEDLLIHDNVDALIRVNTNTPLYLEYFNHFTDVGSFDYSVENTKAYVLEIENNKKIAKADFTTLPSTTVDDNVTKIVSEVSLDGDFSSLNIKRSSSYWGHLKKDEQNEKLKFYDYLDEDYAKYGTERVIDKVSNEKKRIQYKKEFESLVNKIKDKNKEAYKKSLASEFDFEIENPEFKITNTGRFGDNAPFAYQEDFAIKNNLLKKAGNNYIVEIGKILTGQVEIDKKELERKNNIYMPFPRRFENEIILEIPKGYAVSGLEKLNKSIINVAGKFTSNASLNDNKLIIKTVKQYNNYYEPNSNWSNIVSFLDAAYQFSQEKILLKKI
jgi:hypothetical protein